MSGKQQQPRAGSIALCTYCGVISVFTLDLQLAAPTTELLDVLGEDREFRRQFEQFCASRQYLMIRNSDGGENHSADPAAVVRSLSDDRPVVGAHRAPVAPQAP